MKQKDFEVLLLPGDGIGKEISEQAVKLIDWITENTSSNFKIIRGSIGGASIDEYGEPITDETIQNAKKEMIENINVNSQCQLTFPKCKLDVN